MAGPRKHAFRAAALWPTLLAMSVVQAGSLGHAASPAGMEYFERQVRPVLVEQCYSCHSAEAKKGVKGGLRLDSREGLLKGGDTGPAIVPGHPEQSLLIRAVRYESDDLQMPPKGKHLPAE